LARSVASVSAAPMFFKSIFVALLFFLTVSGVPRDLHSFPTRRSSDLAHLQKHRLPEPRAHQLSALHQSAGKRPVKKGREKLVSADRKSTRLNSSHVSISYAVFCLKKKKRKTTINTQATLTTIPCTTRE